MDKTELLRSMVNNLINDKSEQASLDLHNYMTAKMKEVSGISAATPQATDTEIDADTEVSVDDVADADVE